MDDLQGGSGDDTINLGNGNDSADGGAGDDTVNGGSGNDILDGDDDFTQGTGDDVINGGDGDDSLDGGGGADTFRPGGGEDEIDFYDGDAGTVETLLGYDDDDDTIQVDVDFGEEEPDFFTIARTGSNTARVEFFRDAGPGPDGGDVLLEVLVVRGGDARLLDEGDFQA